MDLKLPLVLVSKGHGLTEAWVPGLDGVRGEGPSLAEYAIDQPGD